MNRPTRAAGADLLATLDAYVARVPPLTVRALHLPRVESGGSPNGKFCALELSDGALGLSYVRLDDTFAALPGVLGGHGVDGLAGMAAIDLARGVLDETGARRALGVAAANALSQSLFARAGTALADDRDSLAELDPQPGDRIGMVGLFLPLIPRILARGAALTVIELDPALAGRHDGYRVSLDPADLGACNKVLSTSTILLNDTLDDILWHGRQARWFGLIGPGAGALPDALFARGVTSVGSVRVIDREGFVAALAAGEKWGTYARKYVIERRDYAGANALLARLSGC